MLGRDGAQERHLQQQVDHGTECNRTEDRQRHAAPGVVGFAGQIYRALESIETEYDAAGRHRRKDRGEVARVRAAVHAHLEVPGVKTR